jgi:sugar phosphate permease
LTVSGSASSFARRLWAFFREAQATEVLPEPSLIQARYAAFRRQVLLSSMVGYGLFYFCRKNLSVAMPLMTNDLGYTNTELGALGSWLYITYGVSKLGWGLVADRAHPRQLMMLGLLASGLLNLWFGLSASLGVLVGLWAVNGLFQGTGAPASAKMLATWFGAGERGRKTGIWNISHQAGGGLVLILAGLFAWVYGWRGAFLGPAALTLLGGLLIARGLRDRPEAHGLPPIHEYRDEARALETEATSIPFARLLLTRVLLNWRLWVLALASGMTYIVRYGALDWAPKYLYEVRHVGIAEAGVQASLLELVGIPGALLCGWLSDRVFGSRRAPVVLVSLCLLAVSVWALYGLPGDSAGLTWVFLGLVGFFTYGPQMLLAGVAPVDVSSRRVAAAAVGFVGIVSYAGATLSSRVTGLLLDGPGGWADAFAFWALAAVAGAALCIPLWWFSGVAGRGSRTPSPEP